MESPWREAQDEQIPIAAETPSAWQVSQHRKMYSHH